MAIHNKVTSSPLSRSMWILSAIRTVVLQLIPVTSFCAQSGDAELVAALLGRYETNTTLRGT